MSNLDQLTNSLVAGYADKLDEQQQKVLIEALQVLADDQKYNRVSHFFPDEGLYSRDKYPRHISFFAAGAEFKERGFIAANQCLSPWTFMQTESGLLRSAEVAAATSENVLSWDGESQCVAEASHGILKGIEPMFRLVMDTGEFFDCTRKHRVLTESGYLHIDQLMSLSSGLHSKRTVEDYQASCVEDGYLCDQSLLPMLNNDQEEPPLQADAQEHGRLVWSLEDVMEHVCKYIQVSQLPYRLSSQDDLDSFSGLFSLFQAGKTDKHVLPLTENIQAAHLFLSEIASGLQSTHELRQGELSSCCNLDQLRLYIHDEACTSLVLSLKQVSSLLCLSNQDLVSGDLVFDHDTEHIEIFYPLSHPPLVGGKRIISVVPLGSQPIIDVTVPKTNCYFSAGVIHHNTGKSETGAYEARCHATGKYPHWWTGKRFHKPTIGWIGGDTATTVRDIIQVKIVGGDINDLGTGMFAKEDIISYKTRRNVPDAIEILKIRHISGGVSTIVLKTYEQGRATWQGTVIDWIWVDEECPEDVYGEALIRLMNSGGIIYTTFTPLKGVTPLVLSFLDNDQNSESKYPRWVESCTWDDVPHISEETKMQMLSSTPPQLRDARSRGIPTVGTGMVYPVDPQTIIVDDFPIPKHFKKAYGFDVGWNCTAALWGAWDVDNDVRYVYSEHKQGMAEPIVHAAAIKARGIIKGQIDPASRGRSQEDGKKLYDNYKKKQGLWIVPAINAVETGIFEIYERMTGGKLKIFKSCVQTIRENSLYHRDDNGMIVKKNDHLMDCLRYLNNAPASAWTWPKSPLAQKSNVVNIGHIMNGCT